MRVPVAVWRLHVRLPSSVHRRDRRRVVSDLSHVWLGLSGGRFQSDGGLSKLTKTYFTPRLCDVAKN